MNNLSKIAMGLASLAAVTASIPANALPVTNPDDPRTWQGASVSTFAELYFGSTNLAARQAVTGNGVAANSMLDDGKINTAGWIAGTLVAGSGGGGCLGTSTDSTGTGDYGYFCGGGAVSTYANAIDNLWFQTASELSPGVPRGLAAGGTIYDMGFSANKAAIFNSIDHGPLPQEAIESTVYLSNDVNFATYVQAVVEIVYLEGFHPINGVLWDGFSYVVGTGTSATFRYASVTAVGPGALLPHFGDENEINGIMGLRADLTGCTPGVDCDAPTGVPEPMTLSLLGAGLFGLGMARRRRG